MDVLSGGQFLWHSELTALHRVKHWPNNFTGDAVTFLEPGPISGAGEDVTGGARGEPDPIMPAATSTPSSAATAPTQTIAKRMAIRLASAKRVRSSIAALVSAAMFPTGSNIVTAFRYEGTRSRFVGRTITGST
jgi:hypothetical protein